MSDKPRLGLSGLIARQFLTSEITPLLALVGLLLGLFAVLVTPREEEPQIDVTFANVFIAYPGASAREVEQLVATPAEQILSEIAGVEHIYSASRPGMAVLTVQFEVGQTRQTTIVRLYSAFYSNQDWVPANAGIGQPLIKPMGIDDVPIVAGTLWSDDPEVGAHQLARVAHTIETELQRVPGTRDINTIGAPTRAVNVRLNPQKLAGYGLDIQALSQALMASNISREAGNVVVNNQVIQVQAGSFLSSASDVAELVIGINQDRPIFLQDVAEITLGPDQPEQYVSFGMGPAHDLSLPRQSAVTITVAKQPGANAVEVAQQVIERFEHLKGTFVPEGINATVTRNYGKTANDKAQTLIKKLLFATASVVLLMLVFLGWREAVVVGAAVVVTLAITLFASWAYGFTLNRVSLFALIFSIGILVDDAIVVVENIHRRATGNLNTLTEGIPYSVEEVGGPTILATFTVIAALLPMAFVSGLMGPYMAPIPINASMGMLISLIVAFVFTPWLYRRLFARAKPHPEPSEQDHSASFGHRLFQRLMTPFLRARQGRRARVGLLVGLLVLIGGSVALVGFQAVVLKMLPFDNKSEFQVVLEMPEGTPLEQTNRVLNALGDYLETVPEVLDYQTYSGTASPINFNGLVRQYYLRQEPHQGDIQINLVDLDKRQRNSHDIARTLRAPLQTIGREFGATVKIVEVPPGPPVMAPIVAEVYGLDYRGQMEVAKEVRSVFERTEHLVDIDDDIEAPQRKLVAEVNRQRAARLGVSQQAIADTLTAALSGTDVTYLHGNASKAPIPIRLELNEADKANQALLGSLLLISQSGARVPLSEVVQFRETTRDQTIYHKDLLPVAFVYADIAGPLDSPLYGMLEASATLNNSDIKGAPLAQFWTSQPDNPYAWSLKWDGEWQITYETFRDMGIAYSVGLILIYLLVVAQFRSYGLPLIIMAPIPLTLIGILPGHALLDKQFTATSMIGMIALAGIIVRNSILLVDFVQHQQQAGKPLATAVINAAAVRARPILLTAAAATMGAFFILDDPIFSGLAVSLIFGIAVSTLLTLLVIPVVYYAYHYHDEATDQPA